MKCDGVICVADQSKEWKNKVIWYPGERECTSQPFNKWQKMQRKINKRVKAGTFKYMGLYFTAHDLEKLSRVMNGTKGKDPNKFTE